MLSMVKDDVKSRLPEQLQLPHPDNDAEN